ncbi:MAG: hypothetical protein Q9162_001452 [Coniocarpon cinnabarinum]
MSGSSEGYDQTFGSDASRDSVGASDMRGMTIDGAVRPSSPAKRSASELEDDQQSPTRQTMSQNKSSSAPYVSPLPNRTKPSPLGVDGQGASGLAGGTPSIDEQVQKVIPLIQDQEMLDGTKTFLVPMVWLNRLRSRTTEGRESLEFSKEAREGDIGPIDTRVLIPSSASSDLQNLQDGFGNHVVPLKTGLQAGEDYEFMPREAWDLVMDWYGLAEEAPPLTRIARNTDPDGDIPNYQYELYPPIVTVQKVVLKQERGLESIGDSGKMAVRMVVSRSEKYQDFLKRVKQAAGIDLEIKVRAWKILEPEPNAMPTPEPSRGPSPAPQAAPAAGSLRLVLPQSLLESMPDGVRREELNLNDETMNEKYNGSILVASIGFNQVQTIVLQEQPRASKLDKGRPQDESAPSRITGSTAASSDSGQGPSKTSSGNKPSQRPSIPPPARGRTRKKTRSRGTVGLANLGNTCYMNSALQCLRSVEELTEYFLQQAYLDEINYDNPLGSNGQVAKAYGGLINSLYNTDSGFAPRVFKAAISRHYPTFQGYGQQDSQEFVNALLDGLHEDLNQILKKPYIENPDSKDETVGNAEKIRELGEQYQDNFRKRNESVVIDLFNGWYKNTLVCPDCNKVSITFDPFSQVTLQLPIENTLQMKLMFFPLRDSPRFISLDIDKNASVKAVKEYCTLRVDNVKPENLVMAEEYNNKFFRLLSDNDMFSENLQTGDRINVYELDDSPTNWPPLDKKKPKRFLSALHVSSPDSPPAMTSPHADRMAVPVITRLCKGNRYPHTSLHPFFVLITREEAKDSDLVFRKVLAKLETMTTRELCDDSDLSISPSGDKQGANADDTDSKKPEDSRVEVRTSEGEDDFVDVSLNKAQDHTQSTTNIPSAPKRRSKLLDTSYFIDNEFRNIFDLCVYTGNTVVPAGYSNINDYTRYPKLDDRMSRAPQQRLSTSSRASSVGARHNVLDRNEDAGSESASEDDLAQSQYNTHELGAQSRPDSEDEADMSPGEGLSSSHKAAKPHNIREKFKSFGKNMRRSKSRSEDYVLKLGELLVLDFNQDGFEQLFGGDSADDFRGQRTDLEVPTVADPELDKKRERRSARRKAGVALDDCFDESAKSEVLSEDNAWYCNRCKEMRRATKTLELWSVPDILVVHLKRFGSGGRFGRDKVDVLVDFPTEGLNLNGRVGATHGKDLTYDLFAVDNHMGGLGGGHYTAHAKNFIDGDWYEYNDSFVSRASAQSAVSRSAYLLFYRRRSEKPLGSPKLQEYIAKARIEESSSSSSESERDERDMSGNNSTGSGIVPRTQARTTGVSGTGMLGGASAYAQPLVDEGLGMEEDDEIDNPLPSIEAQSSARSTYMNPTWAFEGLGEGASAPSNSINGANEGSDILNGDGTASDQAGAGSDRDDKMRDFDDDDINWGGTVTHIEHGGLEQGEAEPLVHNVMLSDSEQMGEGL